MGTCSPFLLGKSRKRELTAFHIYCGWAKQDIGHAFAIRPGKEGLVAGQAAFGQHLLTRKSRWNAGRFEAMPIIAVPGLSARAVNQAGIIDKAPRKSPPGRVRLARTYPASRPSRRQAARSRPCGNPMATPSTTVAATSTSSLPLQAK